jgi:hypothetical protein
MNELTAAAIAAHTEEVRSAYQAVRNVERRRIWAENWLERSGTYPKSYDLRALIQQLYISTRDLLLGIAGGPAKARDHTAELLIHPTFLRRRRGAQSNQGVVRFPHHRGQIKRSKLPEPPPAA